MPKYDVEVSHTITVTVPVQADSPAKAHETVSRRDFPLPPRDQWTGGKDWSYVVYGEDGTKLGGDDGDGSGYGSCEDLPSEHEYGWYEEN
jgi:hypothetical protein